MSLGQSVGDLVVYLAEAVRAAWSLPASAVYTHGPLREAAPPYARIDLESLEFEYETPLTDEVRASVSVAGVFPVPPSGGVPQFLADQAEALRGEILIPPGWYLPQLESVRLGDLSDADTACTLVAIFSCRATVQR